MGVKTLWSVLSSSGEMIDLRELQGSTVAIDLAGWIVQNNTCKAMTGHVSRPHMRNLFFRTATMINLNIKPIFVLDGDAPTLKKETLEARKRQQSQNPAQEAEVKDFSRRRLKGLMNECKALLDSLGIVSVKAEGEAESLCATLNAEGIVQAVISDDSDAFCYGAQTLLRNFSISTGNGANVERYFIGKIEKDLKLDRNRLVAMAILLGCDFCPAGVAGIGKESILQLFEMWPSMWNALGALKFWIKHNFKPADVIKTKVKGSQKISYKCLKCKDDQHCELCDQWSLAVENWGSCHCELLEENKDMLKLEESLKKKCADNSHDFWNDTFDKILKEFMQPSVKKSKLESLTFFQVNCPKVDDFVKICVKKMAWTEEYAIEKILPLITRWQVKNPESKIVKADKILKTRTVSGTASFSVQWQWMIEKPDLAPETFETIEPTLYLKDLCPDLIEQFEASKKKPKKKAAKKTTVAKAQETEPAPKITQFFRETKRNPKVSKKNPKIEALKKSEANEISYVSGDENLPDNYSFLIDDILSSKFKRNLSIEEPKTIVTSTPVNLGPKPKKFITPSKISYPKEDVVEPVLSNDTEDFEDSFDRMCNFK